jgi:cbb3-type cytochrome oxidase maturation protein
MQIVFILIFVSVGLALVFLFSFLWANKDGQFEDTYGPAHRILFDDEELNKQKTEKNGSRKVLL